MKKQKKIVPSFISNSIRNDIQPTSSENRQKHINRKSSPYRASERRSNSRGETKSSIANKYVPKC